MADGATRNKAWAVLNLEWMNRMRRGNLINKTKGASKVVEDAGVSGCG